MRRLVSRAARTLLPARLQEKARGWHYARALRQPSFGREPAQDVVRALVGPGDRVVDVGANIGVYTRLLAGLVGPSGRVLSVEPVPVTCRLLRANVRRLELDNVEVFDVALSDRPGRLRFEVPAYEDGGDNYYRARVIEGDGAGDDDGVEVPCTTLDELVGDGDVQFVKCDVEGHELACLRGAGAVLGRRQAAWFVEVAGHPDAGTGTAPEVFALFEAAGYGVWWYDGERLRARQPAEQSNDYFFLREHHQAALQAGGFPVSQR